MKILIAGLGSIGRRHLKNLLALGENDIILYRTHRSTLPDEDLKPFPVETNLQDALSRHRPDAVIVSNPTALHLDVAIPAAEAGCHLLLEKPVSHTLEGIDELRAAVERNQVRVLVGFQFRFHPALQRAKKLIEEQAIGKILSFRAHWGEYLPNWHPWEDYRQGYAARAELGGGVARTLSHPLDYLHMLLGDAESVWAFASNRNLNLEVEDSVEIGLRLKSGAAGTVHLDYNQRPPSHHLEIIGSEGTLRWDNADGVLHLYRAKNEAWEQFPPPEGFERNHLFLAEMRHFLALARGEESSLCTLDEGIYSMKWLKALYTSIEEKRLVMLSS
jgi:predicted dehydrogenase